jgi:putative endonuclease
MSHSLRQPPLKLLLQAVDSLIAEAARRSVSEGGPSMKKYVYLLQSLASRSQRYVGLTANLKARLRAHISGQSVHTAKYRPWRVTAYFAFDDEKRALKFEYLKSGSGRAFASKHF